MVRGYRDNCSASSSSTSNYSLQYQHWRLMDLLLDSALEGSSQKQNSFVSLLPPPPPRTTSKILPPPSPRDNPSPHPSNRPVPMQVRGKSLLKMQEIPVPLDEHQKDEEDWLGVKLDIIKKPIEKECASNSNSYSVYGSSSIYRPFPLSNTAKPGTSLLDNITQHDSNHISRRIFGSPNPSPMASTSIKASSSTHMARPIYTGGLNPQRIAPAVQIRSVIPVCAAPPPVKPPSSSSAISTSPSTTSKSTQPGAEVSMFNQIEPNPTQQLSSEFNNKLQL